VNHVVWSLYKSIASVLFAATLSKRAIMETREGGKYWNLQN
jgi:hypothetical protein